MKIKTVKRSIVKPRARRGKAPRFSAAQKRTFGEVMRNPSPRDLQILTEVNRQMMGLNKMGLRMYDAAVTTNLNLDFPVDITDANAQIFNSIISVRSRARTVDRDNPYAHNAVEAYIDDVCGDEPFKLEMKVGKKDADGQFNLETDTNEEIEKAWAKAGLPENCCADGVTSRNEMDWMAIASLVRDGGVLFKYHKLFPHNRYKFAVEPKEIDFLDSYYSRPNFDNNKSEIQFSIQVDKVYKRVEGYWLFTRHPGAIFTGFSPQVRREFCPIDEMTALFDIRTRAGQYVGMSRIASIIQRLHRIDQFDIAHVTAAIWNSCNPVFFTMEFPTAMELVPNFIKTAMDTVNELGGNYAGEDGQPGSGLGIGQKYNNMEPGSATTLPYGYKPMQLDSKFPAESAVGFNEDQLRAAAAGCQVPLFRFTGDYSKVNFSSGRLGLQSWHDTCERLQNHMIVNYRRPHFCKWLFNAMLTGEVKQPMSRYEELCDAANFYGRRWPYIQPMQDAQADALRLESRTASPYTIARERGENLETIYEEWANAQKVAEKVEGLNIMGDISNPTLKKGEPLEPQPSPADDATNVPIKPAPKGKKSHIFCMECGTRAHNGEAACLACGSDSISVYKEALQLHASRV